MQIQPFILGKGRAGLTIAKSFSLLAVTEPELNILPPKFLKRGQSAAVIPRDQGVTPIMAIAHPHALHAEALLEADRSGIELIFSEKPVATSLDQVSALSEIKAKVGVFHGYRQTWGIQTLRKLIESKTLGEIIAIEGRYWQSSAAERALQKESNRPNWKNDSSLSGLGDVLIDIVPHYLDLACFISDGWPTENPHLWISYANSEASHRDTHVHLQARSKTVPRIFGSISKTVHGRGNELEIIVLGKFQSLAWSFQDADRIVIGEGKNTRTISRSDDNFGVRQPPFHGAGWIEGYVEILRQGIYHFLGKEFVPYPNLEDSLKTMRSLLSSKIEIA